jgi:hypothetical protein
MEPLDQHDNKNVQPANDHTEGQKKFHRLSLNFCGFTIFFAIIGGILIGLSKSDNVTFNGQKVDWSSQFFTCSMVAFGIAAAFLILMIVFMIKEHQSKEY